MLDIFGFVARRSELIFNSSSIGVIIYHDFLSSAVRLVLLRNYCYYNAYVVVEHEVLVGWIGRTLLVAKRST